MPYFPFSGKCDFLTDRYSPDSVSLFIERSSRERPPQPSHSGLGNTQPLLSSSVSGSSGAVGEFWGNLADTFPSNSWSQNSSEFCITFSPGIFAFLLWDNYFMFHFFSLNLQTLFLPMPPTGRSSTRC